MNLGWRSWAVRVSVLLLVALVLVALFANPLASWAPLGMDRFIRGTRSLVVVAAASLLLASLIGLPWGVAAGAGVRLADFALTRAAELFGALPALLLLALIRAGGHASSLGSLVAVLGSLQALRVARLVRGEVRRTRREPFIAAAVALGASPGRILWRHVLPHVLPSAVVALSFAAAWVVGLDAGLAFVGLGLPRDAATWGALLARASDGATSSVWLPPAIGIVLVTGSLTVLAEALDERLAPPRRRGRAAPTAYRLTPR
jgi:ABC-type dipeptide/oligopeptide/nickel transport system permease subunit